MHSELKPYTEYRIYIETLRGSFVKRNEEGTMDFISPIPCPFHYGHVIGFDGGDGDPLDAIFIGDVENEPSQVAQVVGVVRFIDNNMRDDKYIFTNGSLTSAERNRIQRFFDLYAICKNVLAKVKGHATLSHVETVEFWSF